MAIKPGNSNKQKKDFAKLLYTTSDLNQKEIAARVDVNEKTIAKWIQDGMWQYLRKSLLTSKGDQIRRLYEFLNAANTQIENTEGGYGDTKMADIIIKYTAAIRNLETETSAGQMFETGMQFIRFVQKDSFDAAQQITNYFDAFILNELNAKF
jgi:hypothetical protein